MKIDVEKLSFAYQKKGNKVLENLSFVFESEKIYFLNGDNGAGKTTFLKLIMGLIQKKDGKILYDGVEFKKNSTAQIAKKIGFLFQTVDFQLFAPTVEKEMSFCFELENALNEKNKAKIEKLLCDFQLEKLKNDFPLQLSGGEKQKLALATLMLRDVEFLILDEPTSSLDDDGKLFLENFLKEFVKSGNGVLVVSHDYDFQQRFDKKIVLKMEGGKICEN